eukprot:240325-Amphidinium_carterae.1
MCTHFVAPCVPADSGLEAKDTSRQAIKAPLWYKEDGSIASLCWSKVLGLKCRTFFDIIVLMGPLLVMFNVFSE